MNPPEHSGFAYRAPHAAPAAATDLLRGLNAAQREAVTHGAGPLLVLAGAGSGKTRVITHRIAHLILHGGVQPDRIVAVTFTNKAAAEMRERVLGLLGSSAPGTWIGTFHALCLRILRRDGSHIGLDPAFNIYDTDDQLALVKRILKDEADEPNVGTPRSFLSRISRAKNALESPDVFEKRAHNPDARRVARVYRSYEAALRQANVVDFDDLLVRTLELFREHPEVARGYASRCDHLLVDEYQDTNRPQYLLIRALAAEHGNVCVVGDEDQSIYRFRGAEIRNILEFERDHDGTCTIRLEQNYRSSRTIIEAAGAVIANNVYRKGKTLWTENDGGEPLELYRAPDDRLEAVWVSQRARAFESRVPFDEMAVLYRTNAQSRLLEEQFRRDGVPFQIVGSVQFYERKEIKDLLAYLKLAANPADDVAFRRVVNTPPRGIGATTLRVVEEVARGRGSTLLQGAVRALDDGLLPGRSATRMREFLETIAEFARRAADDQVAELVEDVVERIDFESYLERAYAGQGQDRMENVRALVSATVEYVEETERSTLQGFLDRLALVSDADEVGRVPGITLMTIHCAKGLEFSVVFLIGLEENLFPHAMAVGSREDVEEERRLCYVAMTRAKRRLLLAHAQFRRLQGALMPNPPSRFLDEIPGELLRETTDAPAGGYVAEPSAARQGAIVGNASSAARAAARARPVPPSVPRRVAQPAPADGFPIGAFVLHPRFGGGRIVDREGADRALKLTIHFADHGPKKILPAYTQLKVQIDG